MARVFRFRFDKLIGVATLLSAILLAVWVVDVQVPAEDAPARNLLTDGRVQFVVQSRREAAYWPAGAVAILLWTLAWNWISKLLVSRREDDGKSRPALRAVYYLLLAILCLVFADVIVIAPTFRFRTVTLERDKLQFSSLYRGWVVRVSDIRQTHLDRRDVKRHSEIADLTYVIQDAKGASHRSVTITCSRPSAVLGQYEAFFEDVNAEISEARLRK